MDYDLVDNENKEEKENGNEESCGMHSPKEEKRIIMELIEESNSILEEGKLYYAVSSR